MSLNDVSHPTLLSLIPDVPCCLCHQPIKLEGAVVDEHGQAVHSECYAQRITTATLSESVPLFLDADILEQS